MLIGIMYIVVGVLSGSLGFILSILIRIELSLPSYVLSSSLSYNSTITFHGILMIFFMIMPILIGGFGNLLLPILVGYSDMLFPRLNALSLHLLLASLFLLILSMLMDGGINTGWTFYVPLSTYNSSSLDLFLFALHVTGISSLISSINFITTILTSPFATNSVSYYLYSIPVYAVSILITSFLLLISLPVLASCITMLILDRHFNTSFFDPLRGGNVLLFQHLFWFFGHPEVYILILPAFGLVSDILTRYSTTLFGRDAMVFCLLLIAFIGLIVWGHHMFVVGFDVDTRNYFTASTSIIAIPTLVKIFNWAFTLYSSSPHYFLVHYYIVGFLLNFTLGGLTGLILANNSIDTLLHDTYFVVAHFHYVLSLSVVYIIIASFYSYISLLGGTINYLLSNIVYCIFLVSSHILFLPLHVLGILGVPRRVMDYYLYFSTFSYLNMIGTIGMIIAFILFPYTVTNSSSYLSLYTTSYPSDSNDSGYNNKGKGTIGSDGITDAGNAEGNATLATLDSSTDGREDKVAVDSSDDVGSSDDMGGTVDSSTENVEVEWVEDFSDLEGEKWFQLNFECPTARANVRDVASKPGALYYTFMGGVENAQHIKDPLYNSQLKICLYQSYHNKYFDTAEAKWFPLDLKYPLTSVEYQQLLDDLGI